MANAKDLQPGTDRVMVLVYGPSGVGKTYGAATFPKPYFFDTDGGILSVAGKDVEYDTYKDADPARPKAWQNILKKLEQFSKEGCEFETLVFDSLTTLADAIMNDIQRTNGTSAKIPGIQEWGILIDKLREFLIKISTFEGNIVVTAHEQIFQDETTQEVFITPLVPGKKLPTQLAIYFDEVYRAYAETDRNTKKAAYLIQTQASRRYQAKTRLKGLDPVEPFDYDHIMKKVRAWHAANGA